MKKLMTVLAAAMSAAVTMAIEVNENTTVNTSNASTYTGADVISIASGKTLTISPVSGETFSFSGKIRGAGSVTVSGAGNVEFRGDNDFAGGCYVTGNLHVYTDTALGTTAGSTGVGGGKICFYGVTVAETFNVSVENGVLIGQSGETVLSGIVNVQGKNWGPFGAAAGATIRATGTVNNQNNWLCPNGAGTVVFEGPWNSTIGIYHDRGGRMVVCNKNTKSNYSITVANGKILEAGAENVFENGYVSMNTASGGNFYLGGYNQTIAKVMGSTAGNNNTVSSTTPAQVRALASGATSLYWIFDQFAGFAWAGDSELTLAAVSPSAGSLKAESGTLTLASAATWKNATNVTVFAGAKLKLNAAAFGEQVEMFIEDGGTVALLANVNQKVAKLYYKGAQMPAGTYGCKGSGARYEIDGIDSSSVGLIEVVGGEIVDSKETWDGGPSGTGTDIAEKTNWVGDPEVLDLDNGGLTATFAAAGSLAKLTRDVSLKGIEFTAANGFTITNSAAEKLFLGASGIDTVNSANAPVTYTVGVPVAVQKDQTWTAETGVTLKMTDALSGNAGITSDGPGNVELSGNSSAFNGSFFVNNGSVTALSDGALGSGTGVVRMQKKTHLYLCGVDTAAKLQTVNCAIDAADADAYVIRTAENSTNIVRGAFSFQMKSLWAGANSEIVFKGGGNVTGNGNWSPCGDIGCRIVFDEKPVTFLNGIFNDLYSSYPVTLVLRAADFVLGGGVSIYQGNIISCEVPYALNYGKAKGLTLTGGSRAGSHNYFIMNGNDQAVTDLAASSVNEKPNAGTGHVSSDSPATLHVVFSSYKSGDITYTEHDNYAVFEGAAGISGEGTGTIGLGTVSPTTGTLMASNGVVKILASGSWLNCSNVVARGSGTVAFTHAKSVARKATVYIAEDGKVDIASGVTEKIGRILYEVDGKWKEQPIGAYSATSVPKGADIPMSHFTGSGVLHASGLHPGLFIAVF